jgi:hypothetical protein
MKTFERRLKWYKEDVISHKRLMEQLQGWFGYSKWANTHKLRADLLNKIEQIRLEKEKIKLN